MGVFAYVIVCVYECVCVCVLILKLTSMCWNNLKDQKLNFAAYKVCPWRVEPAFSQQLTIDIYKVNSLGLRKSQTKRRKETWHHILKGYWKFFNYLTSLFHVAFPLCFHNFEMMYLKPWYIRYMLPCAFVRICEYQSFHNNSL